MAPKILIIAGPTASGKSALALEIAQKSSGVIINADSQQLYAELRILTARPTKQEEGLVPHRLYGTMSAADNMSSGKWLRFARMEIDWALGEGLVPIVVGGTGLYLKALMEGIADMPDINPQVRAQAVSDYGAMGKEAFAERLRAVDPGFFERLKVYDKQRLIRAYEVWLGSGRPLSWWQAQAVTPPYQAESFALTKVEPPREELYRSCDARFVKMIEEGAIEEVRAFRALGLAEPVAIGIREIGAYLDGKMTLDEAVTAAQQATRNYAKRQLTWLRNQFKTA